MAGISTLAGNPIISDTVGSNVYSGYAVMGIDSNHKYLMDYDGSEYFFFVDNECVGLLSDKRLKSNFEDIDERLLNAVDELKIQQFNIKNRLKTNVGIIAQDLIDVCKKHDIDISKFQILGKTKYKLDDETEYYKIDYLQYLLLKQLATDKKIKQLKEKDKQKDILIQSLLERIERLEANNE